MVEQGQPRGLTGKLQSIQWASMYGASVIVGSLGGYLSAHGLQRLGFVICALATLVTLMLAVFFVREEPRRESGGDGLTTLRELDGGAESPGAGRRRVSFPVELQSVLDIGAVHVHDRRAAL